MAPRIAKSLDRLRSQVNAAYPQRSKISDGWIGDAAHSSRDSDHNPNAADVVQAVDLTHDPEHGFDSWKFADVLRQNQDRRLKYVISNGRIFSSTTNPWTWRKYTGANAHAHHVHISVVDDAAIYDSDSPWMIVGLGVAQPTPQPPPVVVPGITDAMRRKMAQKIIGYEVKRDARGHFAVHSPGDGSHEIAGISSTSNPAAYQRALALLKSGQHAELEKQVEQFVLDYTKAATGWTTDAGVEFYLRDSIYNRGPVGGAKILQKALNVAEDGEIGPTTRAAIALFTPATLLTRLREARELYEIEKYGRRPKLWPGMVNRWDKALADAEQFKGHSSGVVVGGGGAVIIGGGTAIAKKYDVTWDVIIPIAIIAAAVVIAAVFIARHRRRSS